MIPLGERHLYRIVKAWINHYNAGRPHMSLGPGIPQPPMALPAPFQAHRHQLPTTHRVTVSPILSGLHHEYNLENKAA
jgi:hypothetical protein